MGSAFLLDNVSCPKEEEKGATKERAPKEEEKEKGLEKGSLKEKEGSLEEEDEEKVLVGKEVMVMEAEKTDGIHITLGVDTKDIVTGAGKLATKQMSACWSME